MQIKTISYSALINLGNYSNERIGFTAQLAEGESIPDAVAALRQQVVSNASLNSEKAQSMLYRSRDELAELERKIQKATNEWNAIAEFLRAQGIKPDAVDMPKLSLLLPEFKEEQISEGEIEEEEEDDY